MTRYSKRWANMIQSAFKQTGWTKRQLASRITIDWMGRKKPIDPSYVTLMLKGRIPSREICISTVEALDLCPARATMATGYWCSNLPAQEVFGLEPELRRAILDLAELGEDVAAVLGELKESLHATA